MKAKKESLYGNRYPDTNDGVFMQSSLCIFSYVLYCFSL